MAIYAKPTLLPELASGVTPIYAWTASTAYTSGTYVSLGGAIYRCTTSGTSASSGGPSGTSSSITDGTAVWAYSRAALGAGPAVEPSATQKSGGISQALLADGSIFGLINYLFQNLWQWMRYLSSLSLQSFSWLRQHAFSQTLTATNAPGTAWANTTAYAVDDIRTNDSGKVYICTTAGTSAGSGGPTGTGSAITDGTVVWKYVRGPAPAVDATSTVTGQAAVKGTGTLAGAPGVEANPFLLLTPTATDPTTPTDGMIWYNSTSDTYKGCANGTVVTFTVT